MIFYCNPMCSCPLNSCVQLSIEFLCAAVHWILVCSCPLNSCVMIFYCNPMCSCPLNSCMQLSYNISCAALLFVCISVWSFPTVFLLCSAFQYCNIFVGDGSTDLCFYIEYIQSKKSKLLTTMTSTQKKTFFYLFETNFITTWFCFIHHLVI